MKKFIEEIKRILKEMNLEENRILGKDYIVSSTGELLPIPQEKKDL